MKKMFLGAALALGLGVGAYALCIPCGSSCDYEVVGVAAAEVPEEPEAAPEAPCPCKNKKNLDGAAASVDEAAPETPKVASASGD